MKEIIRSHDQFKLRLIAQFLESHDIYAVVMDDHVGGLYHGLAGMAARLMVLDDDVDEAVRLIRQAQDCGELKDGL